LERTRILLVEMPRMLCDIITDVVASQSDMIVVGELPGRAGLLAAADRTRADVIVFGLGDADLPDDCAPLFEAHPHIRLLGVAADGRRAFLYELRPQRTPLGEVSPQALLDAIRLAARSHAV
jgi:DNA-binding NarL/FixJ family response regulator